MSSRHSPAFPSDARLEDRYEGLSKREFALILFLAAYLIGETEAGRFRLEALKAIARQVDDLFDFLEQDF
ncbi:hypothetical protein L3556_00925 [Candidatus Synechococcus calcipolaris G9]|uniref:Uncharacterized protein n=1 Tax=Candidatus Synechococcus calcipolaris G9 TaxID=1497997 RepID=A0ABT6EUE8_9SYNE|nr:hypothetical protein [Candidatus Synechococcus calcipolaris]MDG2989501.1 hypothetical protein [Candidatus Synechococcus calcipolaris G9]